jgi:hypothetical protein
MGFPLFCSGLCTKDANAKYPIWYNHVTHLSPKANSPSFVYDLNRTIKTLERAEMEH